jgi:hypothetical protein
VEVVVVLFLSISGILCIWALQKGGQIVDILLCIYIHASFYFKPSYLEVEEHTL